MSYGAEMLEAILIESFIRDIQKHTELDALRDLMKQGIWVTKQNKKIPIQNMTSNHLRNSISKMNRDMDQYDEYAKEIAEQYIEKMQAELSRRYPPVDPAFAFD